MDNQPPQLKFAVIGHQDNWKKIIGFVNSIRESEGNSNLSLESIREIYHYFPPSKLFDIEINSNSGKIEGYYIESFMPPDGLGIGKIWDNLSKTKAACEKAAVLGADIVALGGFTSIVLESGTEKFTAINNTKFTTGNTLTAAIITDSIQKAALRWGPLLKESNLLVIGSTGDIGSACVRYFAGKVKELLLNARQSGPLTSQKIDLKKQGFDCESDTDVRTLLPNADYIICVASSVLPTDYGILLKKDAIICDAGYPKNLSLADINSNQKIYSGGMCLVENGYRFYPDHFQKNIYEFPLENISHGCTMESVVLALEGKAVSFSQGRGNITVENMEYILKAAKRHGIVTAPFFNSSGLLK